MENKKIEFLPNRGVSIKKSPHPAVAGLPNKDSGVRLWGLEPQTP